MPPYTGIGSLRVATYNIHKGVRGIGPRKRLEIHNLGLAVESFDADLVFLQEVRLFNRRDALHFDRTYFGWPEQGQAEFLAPLGYDVAYRTNAVTRHGEHGNALLSRWPIGDIGHHDVSDHRFEQRGLLHVPVNWNGSRCTPWWCTSGWCMPAACARCSGWPTSSREVPDDELLVVAGDFNDWGRKLDAPMAEIGLQRARARLDRSRALTFPSLMPVFALDRFYCAGWAAARPWCRAAPPGPACPTTCRWWPNSSRCSHGRHRAPRLHALGPCAAGALDGRQRGGAAARRRRAVPAHGRSDGRSAPRGLAGHLHLPRRPGRPPHGRRADRRGGAWRRRCAWWSTVSAATTRWSAARLAGRQRRPLEVFRPLDRWWSWLQPGQLRRLHQKLCVVDGEVAFVGGINVIDDRNDLHHGASEQPRLDFAVELRGPLVPAVGARPRAPCGHAPTWGMAGATKCVRWCAVRRRWTRRCA
jgi:endonuclease/exonuclease/phosphatase family metal-dependent hydrolase